MSIRLLIIAAIIALVAGSVFIATRTIPAPRHTVEKVLSHDRFFK